MSVRSVLEKLIDFIDEGHGVDKPALKEEIDAPDAPPVEETPAPEPEEPETPADTPSDVDPTA